jgi:hypothetical protein
MLPKETDNTMASSRLTRSQITYQQASLTCPYKVDVFAIDQATVPEKPFTVTACITDSADLETDGALKGHIDTAVSDGGYSPIDYGL